MTETARAMDWLTRSRDTGISSQAIMAKMLGGKPEAGSYPSDPADLGRCLRLLERIPEWKARIGEMATVGFVWAALVARWDELRQSMEGEVGIDWSRGKKAPKTYDLMKKIEGAAYAAQSDYRVELSEAGHLRYAEHKSR